MSKSVATKSDEKDNKLFLKLEDLRKDNSVLTLFIEQMKDHLGQYYGEYGYIVATTGKSLTLDEPRIEDFIGQVSRTATPNDNNRPGTRQATRDASTPQENDTEATGNVSQNYLRRAQELHFRRPISALSRLYRFEQFYTVFIPYSHSWRFYTHMDFITPRNSERFKGRSQQRFLFNSILYIFIICILD